MLYYIVRVHYVIGGRYLPIASCNCALPITIHTHSFYRYIYFYSNIPVMYGALVLNEYEAFALSFMHAPLKGIMTRVCA